MRRRVTIGLVVLAVLVGAGAAVVVLTGKDDGLPHKEVAAYLDAWHRFDSAAMAAVVAPPVPAELAAAVGDMRDDLAVTSATFTPGPLQRANGTVRAPFTADLDLAGLGRWSYPGTLELGKVGGTWKVAWS
ncbi:MAG TPA: NTF2-like N-terminal transpeptidase domain-containing protein, partial [Acidimicrobiales bacterium]|nr:NTF2-like N-terminal transpeptidase domain-containing protein [Acidimicrobiales bacterium]